MRGGEYVLEAIAGMFPGADLYTLIHSKGRVSPELESLKIHTSWLQRIPGIEREYRKFLPLFPAAIESFDLSGYDLIISSSHCVAKGVRKRKGAVHISYVHAPMRYVWDRFDDYFGPGRAALPVRTAARAMRGYLQRWDRKVSGPERIDAMIANSAFIARQIREHYGREATVIHPFTDPSRFAAPRTPGAAYLMVGAFAPNKRVDLAIEAFNRLKLPLQIVGGGQDDEKLRAMAGPTIEFLGSLSNEAITELYSKCRAFVFPGIEDFGITPLEAMAAGAPVIAYAEGGATETVTPETGVLFAPQSVGALCAAVGRIESDDARVSEQACRARAAAFTRERFVREFREVLGAFRA